MNPADAANTGAAARFWTGWGALLAGAIYGLLLVLAFPPVGMWRLALLLAVPLAYAAARGTARPLRAGVLAGLGSLPAWLFQHLWLIDVTAPGFPLLAIGLSVFTGAFVTIVALGCRTFGPRVPLAVSVPVVWTGLEFLRGDVAFTGYPWFLAAHPLIEAPALAAPAAWLGTYFVSFLVAALGGAVVTLIHTGAGPAPSGRRLALGVLAVVAGVWGIAAAARDTAGVASPQHTARIALVQTNLPQSNKMSWTLEQRLRDWMRFDELTRRAVTFGVGRPDLIVWPETMFPGDSLNPEAIAAATRAGLVWRPADDRWQPVPWGHFAEQLAALQRELDVPMLVGATAVDGLEPRDLGDGAIALDFRARYNSAFIVSAGTIRAERYDKLHLTPFGEVIPYVWRWPAVQQALLDLGAAGMAFDLTHGTAPKVFEVPVHRAGEEPRTLRFATPICFEATMPAVCRRLAYEGGSGGGGGGRGRLGVDVLINLSNDGWFGPYRAGREQHLQVSRWRAVELGVPMVRAVNTGISASIDRHGRLLSAGPAGLDQRIDVDGVLMAVVPIGAAGGPGTLYGRTGEWFAWVMVAGTGLLAVGAVSGGRAWGRRVGGRRASSEQAGATPADPKSSGAGRTGRGGGGPA